MPKPTNSWLCACCAPMFRSSTTPGGNDGIFGTVGNGATNSGTDTDFFAVAGRQRVSNGLDDLTVISEPPRGLAVKVRDFRSQRSA